MNSYHLQNHGLGKGKGTWVTEAAGPSVSYYALDLKKAIGVFVGYQNCSLWTHHWRGSSLGIKLKRLLGIHPGMSQSSHLYSII